MSLSHSSRRQERQAEASAGTPRQSVFRGGIAPTPVLIALSLAVLAIVLVGGPLSFAYSGAAVFTELRPGADRTGTLVPECGIRIDDGGALDLAKATLKNDPDSPVEGLHYDSHLGSYKPLGANGLPVEPAPIKGIWIANKRDLEAGKTQSLGNAKFALKWRDCAEDAEGNRLDLTLIVSDLAMRHEDAVGNESENVLIMSNHADPDTTTDESGGVSYLRADSLLQTVSEGEHVGVNPRTGVRYKVTASFTKTGTRELPDAASSSYNILLNDIDQPDWTHGNKYPYEDGDAEFAESFQPVDGFAAGPADSVRAYFQQGTSLYLNEGDMRISGTMPTDTSGSDYRAATVVQATSPRFSFVWSGANAQTTLLQRYGGVVVRDYDDPSNPGVSDHGIITKTVDEYGTDGSNERKPYSASNPGGRFDGVGLESARSTSLQWQDDSVTYNFSADPGYAISAVTLFAESTGTTTVFTGDQLGSSPSLSFGNGEGSVGPLNQNYQVMLSTEGVSSPNLEVKAKKDLRGGTLSTGAYSFELYKGIKGRDDNFVYEVDNANGTHYRMINQPTYTEEPPGTGAYPDEAYESITTRYKKNSTLTTVTSGGEEIYVMQESYDVDPEGTYYQLKPDSSISYMPIDEVSQLDPSLYDSRVKYKQTAITPVRLQTKTNSAPDADGYNIIFDSIPYTYNASKTYPITETYSIAETPGTDGSVFYDSKVIIVEVTVNYDRATSTLSVEASYPDGDSFTNYKNQQNRLGAKAKITQDGTPKDGAMFEIKAADDDPEAFVYDTDDKPVAGSIWITTNANGVAQTYNKALIKGRRYQIRESYPPSGWMIDDESWYTFTASGNNGTLLDLSSVTEGVALHQTGETTNLDGYEWPNVRVTSPGISVAKSVSPTSAGLGDTLTYTLTISNTGDCDLETVTYTDPLLGITEPQEVRGGIAQGQRAVVRIPVTHTVTAEDNTRGYVENTAEVVGHPAHGTDVSDSDTISTTIIPKGGMTVAQSASPATVTNATPGTNVTWSFTVTNTGTMPLHDLIVMTDYLASRGASVTLNKTAIDLGETATGTVTVPLTQAEIDSGSITNEVIVTSRDPNDQHVEARAQTSVTIERTANLTVAKTVDKENANVGDVLSYGVTVTNTGNVTLTNVTITDELLNLVAYEIAPSLEPNGTITYNAGTYAVKTADAISGGVTNIVRAHGNPPMGVSSPTDPTASVTTAVTALSSGLSLTKTAYPTSVANAAAGTPVSWGFTVTNTGNTTLVGVGIDDPMLAGRNIAVTLPKTTLSAGESVSVNVPMPLTSDDIVQGTILNTAVAKGTPDNGGEAVSSEQASAQVSATANNAAMSIAVTANKATATVGDTIGYTVTVTNVGTETLSNVLIDDPLLGMANHVIASSLAPGATATWNQGVFGPVTEEHIVSMGTIANVASVRASAPAGVNAPVDQSATAVTQLVAQPSIRMEKTVSPAIMEEAKAGDEVSWTLTVTNTGNVTLSHIAVSDAYLTGRGESVAGFPQALAAGDSASMTFKTPVTQAEINAGKVDNVATVTAVDALGTAVSSQPASATITLGRKARLSVSKVSNRSSAKPNDMITYTVTITNTGNVAVSSVKLSDALLGVSHRVVASTLAPGDSVVVSLSGDQYSVSEQNATDGQVTNVATASAVAPSGVSAPETASAEVTTPVTASPSIAVLQSALPASLVSAQPGDTILWTFTIMNTGDVTLHDIGIKDTPISTRGIDVSEIIGDLTLAPGMSAEYGVDISLTRGDIRAKEVVNVITATGKTPWDEVIESESAKKTVLLFDEADNSADQGTPQDAATVSQTSSPDGRDPNGSNGNGGFDDEYNYYMSLGGEGRPGSPNASPASANGTGNGANEPDLYDYDKSFERPAPSQTTTQPDGNGSASAKATERKAAEKGNLTQTGDRIVAMAIGTALIAGIAGFLSWYLREKRHL